MQVIVYKTYLFLKIRTEKGWIETKLPDWEDFRRLAFYLRYLENSANIK
jgi:hypothetical protein